MSGEFPRSSWRKHSRLALVLSCIFAALPAHAQYSDGLWKSDGYGLLIEIQGESMQAFETTSISCVRSWSAHRSESLSLDGVAVFQDGDRVIRIADGASFHTKKNAL
jgi:hypothetical protein